MGINLLDLRTDDGRAIVLSSFIWLVKEEGGSVTIPIEDMRAILQELKFGDFSYYLSTDAMEITFRMKKENEK
jgi:hypothetical protein